MSSLDDRDALRPAGRALRTVRSVAAALGCVLAAGIGHHTAGGTLAPAAVFAVFVGAAVIAWTLASRRIAPSQLVGLLLLCQVGVHLAQPHGEMTMGPTMLAGHLVATLVSAISLSYGERFVWLIAERLGLRVIPLVRAAILPAWQRPRLPVVVLRPRRDARLVHSLWLRGPPVGLV